MCAGGVGLEKISGIPRQIYRIYHRKGLTGNPWFEWNHISSMRKNKKSRDSRTYSNNPWSINQSISSCILSPQSPKNQLVFLSAPEGASVSLAVTPLSAPCAQRKGVDLDVEALSHCEAPRGRWWATASASVTPGGRDGEWGCGLDMVLIELERSGKHGRLGETNCRKDLVIWIWRTLSQPDLWECIRN